MDEATMDAAWEFSVIAGEIIDAMTNDQQRVALAMIAGMSPTMFADVVALTTLFS